MNIQEYDQEAMEAAKSRFDKENAKRWAEIDPSAAFAGHLGRLTKSELADIRQFWDIRGASSLNKAQLIALLEERIPEKLAGALSTMDETKYRLLKKAADGGGQAALSFPRDAQDWTYWHSTGIVFTGSSNRKKLVVMPEPVLESFRRADTASLRETVRRNTEWIQVTKGLLHYYGTLDFNDLDRIVLPLCGPKAESVDLLNVLLDAARSDPDMVADVYGLSASWVPDPEEVRRGHRDRPGLAFRPFTKEQALAAADPNFVERGPEYSAFVDFLKANYRMSRAEADEIVEECVLNIQSGCHLGESLEALQEQLEVNEIRLLQGITDHLAILHNSTRQWVLKGHSPNELSRSRKEAAGAAGNGQLTDIAAKRKVGRNDPCPCGSGKKYKKCCGG
ncbi:SEC-C metal-binding domain-containing protein [Paenibacillus flagellatus]|nr:SEC-C metal-binding domain-containing protein [Paenibacillus flagellatus]